MAKPYRSRSRLMLDVLDAIQREQPMAVTRLLTAANLTHARLREHLTVLEQNGWVMTQEHEGRSHWVLTHEGKRVLEELRRVDQAMRDFGLEL